MPTEIAAGTEEAVAIARQEQIQHLSATMLPSNTAVGKICERLGFRVQSLPGEEMLGAALTLSNAEQSAPAK